MSKWGWFAVFLAPALLVAFSGLVLSQAPAGSPTPAVPQAPAASLAPAVAPQEKLAPPTPIAQEKSELGDSQTWKPEWDKIVEDALTPDLLSAKVAKDVKPFCPRFNGLDEADKRAYWAYFFQALSGAEAGLEPTANVRHTEPEVAVKDGVSHRMVRSEGLLQLTYEDAERYGCAFDWDGDKQLPEHAPEKTILQPKNNLTCGVRILSNQLIDQHKPLLSRSSYWSTLRPGFPGYQTFLAQMANVPAACGKPHVRVKRSSESTTTAASVSAGPPAAGVN